MSKLSYQLVLASIGILGWMSLGEATPQTFDKNIRARLKVMPDLDRFYPRSMMRRGTPGAAAQVKVCIDASGDIAEEPRIITPSFVDAFDTAIVKMVKRGTYEPGVVDGVPQPGCTYLAFYAEYKVEASSKLTKAINELLPSLEARLPSISGEVETVGVRSVDAKVIWDKVYWRLPPEEATPEFIRGLYEKASQAERQQYCSNERLKALMQQGISFVSWYKSTDGNTLFGILIHENSC